MKLTLSTQAQAEGLAALMIDFYTEDPSMKPMPAESALAKVQKLLRLNGTDVHFFSIDTACPAEFKGAEAPHGYVLVTHFYSNEYDGNVALLDELYIAPQYRGQGAGGKVMQALLRWVEEQGFCAAILETTPDNDRARALYVRNGFREIDRIFMGNFDI